MTKREGKVNEERGKKDLAILKPIFDRAGKACATKGQTHLNKLVTIYTVDNCPKCEALKAAMHPIRFVVVDMSTSEALTELRTNGVFSLAAPILQVGEEFYTVEDLFVKDDLRIEKLDLICKPKGVSTKVR